MTLSLKALPRPVFAQQAHNDTLSAQDVHIYRLDIRKLTAAHQAEAERIMNTAERGRAQKFMRGRESYIASRWLLRTLLARYTNLTPTAVEFLRTDKGKPYLPHSDIHFNLSHSGDWVLMAVGKTELIGIDIETLRGARDLCGIAERYYHPQEYSQLQSLQGGEQADYFYRLWTLKEAFFKALGTGISAGLDSICFTRIDPHINAQIAPELNSNNAMWQFHQWAPGDQIYAALAIKSAHPLNVIWFDALPTPAFP